MEEPHPPNIDENLLNTAISFPPTVGVGLNHQSYIMDGQNSLVNGHGISIPFMLQGDAINNSQACLTLPNFPRAVDTGAINDLLPGRNRIKEFSLSASYPIGNSYTEDQYMEGIPLSAVSLANLLAVRGAISENPENLSELAPLSYHPIECQKIDGLDCPNVLNPSFGSYRNSEFEIAGTVVGRTGSQPFQLTENVNSNTWLSSETASLSSGSPSGSSRLSNELSLSLTTSQSAAVCGATIRDQCSDISCSGVTNHAFRQRHFESEPASCNSRNLSLNVGSYNKPIQFSQFLTGSRYLRVMQEILSKIAQFSIQNQNLVGYRGNGREYGANTRFTSASDAGRGYAVIRSDDLSDGDHRFIGHMDCESKKKHLVALLQVVDDQYNQCLDEIHMVISAFHAVTELDPSIHARFALQTISSLYKNLRERISNYILAMGERVNKGGENEVEKSFETSFIQKQWALQQLKRKDHQLWRPQRGLPERSVSVLRAWMFQNFLHPYPKDSEKQLLAVKSGLTRSQVSNWFINARVRLWKPMIEEMYAEMNRRKICGNENEANNRRNHNIIENCLFTMK